MPAQRACSCRQRARSLRRPPPAERLRRLFDSPPSAHSLLGVSCPAQRLLVTGRRMRHADTVLAKQPAAAAQRGRAVVCGRELRALPDSAAAPRLRRYQRLLVLEEAAMEADIAR